LRDIERLYRGLTAAIAAEIQFALTPQEEARLASARQVNPQAYEAYLRGEFHVWRLTPQDLETAQHYFERALEHDPQHALAYAGIARVWATRQQMGIVAPEVAAPRARAAVQRALELDSALVEVQYAAATVMALDWDWVPAERAFQRAIALAPEYPGVRAGYSHFLNVMDRADEAIRQAEQGLELDPFDVRLQMFAGWSLLFLDRYDEAIAQFQKAPDDWMAYTGIRCALVGKGTYEEALAVLREHAIPEVVVALDSGFVEGGYQSAFLRAAEVLSIRSHTTYVQPTWIAELNALGGEYDRAFEWLDRAVEMREPSLLYLNAFPEFDGLHDDPRWEALLRRMGLPH
jgi:tetratricopeptide (TPR) repeat protein